MGDSLRNKTMFTTFCLRHSSTQQSHKPCGALRGEQAAVTEPPCSPRLWTSCCLVSGFVWFLFYFNHLQSPRRRSFDRHWRGWALLRGFVFLLLCSCCLIGSRNTVFAFYTGMCAGIMWDFLPPQIKETAHRLNYPKRKLLSIVITIIIQKKNWSLLCGEKCIFLDQRKQ